MELSALLKNIRKRWREDANSEFYQMTDRQIDAELQRARTN